MFPVTSLFAALLCGLYLFATARVVNNRRRARVSLGAGGDAALTRAIRSHGNLAEYMPLGLILLALHEAQGTPSWVLYVFGLVLFVGRLIHFITVSKNDTALTPRVTGMLMTLTTLAAMGLGLLWYAI